MKKQVRCPKSEVQSPKKNFSRHSTSHVSRLLSHVFLLVLGSWLFAQQSFSQASSPYSRFGLGDLRSTVFSANKSMGELAAPYASAVNINYTNPASYASLSRTTIELGANINGTNIHTPDSNYRASAASVNHFALAFVPNAKHNSWAISMGLLPYSDMNYTFVQNFNDPALGAYDQVYSGTGSLYQVYLGGAYKVAGFSIGANVGFLFGRLSYQKDITFPDTAYAYNTRNITNMNVRGIIYNAGIQYQKRIYHNNTDPDPRSDIYIYLGAYGSSGMTLRTNLSNYWERFSVVDSVTTIIDTPAGNFNSIGKIKLPFTAGGGVMFGNERFWMFGADYKYANWSAYTTPLSNGGLKNSWQVSVGGQITPKYDDSRKYFNRVQYRVGGFFGKSEIAVNGNALSEAGGTFGLGFPFKSVARLNFTGEFGSLGSSDKSVIRQTYYNIIIGFVLNDIWFVKRKFD